MMGYVATYVFVKRMVFGTIVGGLFLAGLYTGSVHAFVHTNFFEPYDAAVKMPELSETSFIVGARLEYGSNSTGRTWDKKDANVLQLHDKTQSALSMLQDAKGDVVDKINTVKTTLDTFSATDDGTRGHQKVTGDFDELDATVFARYELPFDAIPGTVAISAHLPIKHKDVDSVKIEDMTSAENTVPADRITRTYLTDASVFKTNVKEFGGLSLDNWSQTGAGDLVLMLDWNEAYKVRDEYLDYVTIAAKLGVSIPTGKEKDEDQAFAMALGNDGAWGLPFGVGLELDFDWDIKLGVDFDFLVLFDETRTRRLKTNMYQTEFLLLNKGLATKEHGFTWQAHAYLQAFRFFYGLSAKVAYMYTHHDNDKFVSKSDGFDSTIINTAKSLENWDTHNLIFSLNYDGNIGKDGKEDDWWCVPQVQLFYKLPVGGKNVIDCHTWGGQIGVSF